MTTISAIRWLGLVLLMAAMTDACAKPKAPGWVAQASMSRTPDFARNAAALVLIDESVVKVQSDGTFAVNERRAVRLLTNEGRDRAVAAVNYVTGAGKVSSLRAWLVRADGTVREFGKKEIVDLAVNSSALELYGESRAMVIAEAKDEARQGDVFAYECEMTDRSDFAELSRRFNGQSPVLNAAITVTLPSGWSLRSRIENHPPFEPVVNGSTYEWRMRDLPGLREEPWAPRDESTDVVVRVALVAPENVRRTNRVVGKESWSQLAEYFQSDYDAASTPNAEVQAMARAAVGDATTPWEKIVRLCRVAQDVRYISISLNIARSGGYRPRSAAEVARVGYGDCKDKSVFLRALLRSVGLDGREMFVSSRARYDVAPEWVSPGQFNHCILTIPLDDSAPAGIATIEDAGGRRWLVFDPTDSVTPPGKLDREGLSARGLWLSTREGGIVELPPIDEARSVVERSVQLTLDERGHATGSINSVYHGDDATPMRSWRKRDDDDKMRKGLERWFDARVPVAKVDEVVFEDRFDDDQLALSFKFSGAGYGRLMRDVLMVFHPVVLPYDFPRLEPAKRTLPIRLNADRSSEVTTIQLPAGYVVDELPPAVNFDSEFGSLRFTVEHDPTAHTLRVERQLTLKAGEWPKERANEVKAFIERLREAEQTPVVLARP